VNFLIKAGYPQLVGIKVTVEVIAETSLAAPVIKLSVVSTSTTLVIVLFAKTRAVKVDGPEVWVMLSPTLTFKELVSVKVNAEVSMLSILIAKDGSAKSLLVNVFLSWIIYPSGVAR
jgi:hypothetical protein